MRMDMGKGWPSPAQSSDSWDWCIGWISDCTHGNGSWNVFFSTDDCKASINSSCVEILHMQKHQRFYFSLEKILRLGSGYWWFGLLSSSWEGDEMLVLGLKKIFQYNLIWFPILSLPELKLNLNYSHHQTLLSKPSYGCGAVQDAIIYIIYLLS